jgi:hypothetical protein
VAREGVGKGMGWQGNGWAREWMGKGMDGQGNGWAREWMGKGMDGKGDSIARSSLFPCHSFLCPRFLCLFPSPHGMSPSLRLEQVSLKALFL